MKQPKVSIVVPVYNKIEYIDAMLESVYNQVWDNIQLILVNDGATDGTREKLEAWRPRFEKLGYEVVVVDQQNQGVNAAVRNGLLRATGEYVCCVDCDDELYPEYVSAMADFLEENPSFEWACCDFEEIWENKEGRFTKPSPLYPEPPDNGRFLENYLLLRTNTTSWLFLIRKSYLDKCRVIENFILQPVASQEPCLLIQLGAGGGALKYLPRVLFRHNKWGKLRDQKKHYEEEFPDYCQNYATLARLSVLTLEIPETQKRTLLGMQSLGELKMKGRFENVFSEKPVPIETAKSALSVGSQLFPVSFSAQEILNRGVQPFVRAMEARLSKIQERLSGRLIGYGCLGQRAFKYIPELRKAGFPLSLYWDKGAVKTSSVHSHPVTLPDFDAVMETDTLIVFPHGREILSNVQIELNKQKNQSVSIIHSDDILLLESFAIYPELKSTPLREGIYPL